MLVLYWLLVAVMMVGVIGAIVPGIPGSSLIVIAVVVWGVLHGFNTVVWALVTSLVVFALSLGIDFLATYWGARQAGASSWGQIGAIAGLFLGFFGLLPALPFGGPILGILFGPLLGAFIGEFLYRKELPTDARMMQAFKAGFAIVVSSLIGRAIQGLLALVPVIVFLTTTWSLVRASF